MGDRPPAVRHHAVLIGIDAYPVRALNSCVHDVETMKECLETKTVLDSIRMLTARAIDSEVIGETKWPSYRNVTRALAETTHEARQGDFVYIHFSGHGTRFAPDFTFSNSSTGDLALVLLQGDQSREIFLRGPELAGLLKSMIERDLKVTLVLDCCFSATVYRKGGGSVRYMAQEEITWASPTGTHDDEADLGIPSGGRNGSMRDNWLLDPDRYTVLAACGPHEIAKGGFDTSVANDHYGALSYFLRKTIEVHGVRKRHREIYQHVCAKFRQQGIAQRPVLYGNSTFGFLGHAEAARIASPLTVIRRAEGLQLLAGAAHGFSDGDRIAMYPISSATNSAPLRVAMVHAASVGPLTSELEVLSSFSQDETEWIAEPVHMSYYSRFPIYFDPSIPLIEECCQALGEQSLKSALNKSQAAFQVEMTGREYGISDGSGARLDNLPSLLQDQTDSRRLCAVLQHLVRHSTVKDLNNESPTTAFRDSLTVHIESGSQVFDPQDRIELKHKATVRVVIENRGAEDLYAHVYNVSPSWAVENMLYATHEAIPPFNASKGFYGRFVKQLKVTVPIAMRALGSCVDIIKVIVTSQPTSFASLELPKLEELQEFRVGNRTNGQSHLQQGVGTAEEWISYNFSIRTSL